MNKDQLQHFTDGAQRYFSVNLGLPTAKVSDFRVMDPHGTPAYEYTGIIGISGERNGCVYFTAPRELLVAALTAMGEPDIDDDLISDIIGEFSNTIAGYAVGKLGNKLSISVPVVVQGKPEHINLPKNYVVHVATIAWKDFRSDLIVCFE